MGKPLWYRLAIKGPGVLALLIPLVTLLMMGWVVWSAAGGGDQSTTASFLTLGFILLGLALIQLERWRVWAVKQRITELKAHPININTPVAEEDLGRMQRRVRKAAANRPDQKSLAVMLDESSRAAADAAPHDGERDLWRVRAERLYQLLDDISALDDMAKDNDVPFRRGALDLAGWRNAYATSVDGRGLDWHPVEDMEPETERDIALRMFAALDGEAEEDE